jgi:hypothetical protein
MTIQLIVSNPVNIVSIPGDYGNNLFPAIYDSTTFSFDITIVSGTTDGNGNFLTYKNITNVSVLTLPTIGGLTVQVINSNPNAYVIRFSGPVTGAFNQTFQFQTVNNGLQYLPVDTNVSYYGIVNWNPPSSFTETVTHTLTLTYDDYSTEQTNVDEIIYWNNSVWIAKFKTAVSQGIA